MPTSNPLPPKENALFKRILVSFFEEPWRCWWAGCFGFFPFLAVCIAKQTVVNWPVYCFIWLSYSVPFTKECPHHQYRRSAFIFFFFCGTWLFSWLWARGTRHFTEKTVHRHGLWRPVHRQNGRQSTDTFETVHRHWFHDYYPWLMNVPVIGIMNDNGYPHDGRADKSPYPHDCRADKDSYPHDSNNLCIILRLQRSFAMINVWCLFNWFHIIPWYLVDFATNMCQYYYFICA